MKREKIRVMANLKKLHRKMLADMIAWSVMYKDSGAMEYLTSHDDEAFSVHEVISGKVLPDDIAYQIKYIEEFVTNGDKKEAKDEQEGNGD